MAWRGGQLVRLSLTTNQPPAISQQYFSLGTNQHQPNEQALLVI
jgi:hypothetical protein